LIYGLTAVGFALIFGTCRIFDLAFGSYYLVGAYSFFGLAPVVGNGAALFLSLLISIAVALLIHRFVLFPLRKFPIRVLVASAGLALAIQQGIILVFGSTFRSIPYLVEGTTRVAGVIIENQRFLAGGVAIVALILLWLFLTKTKLGLGIRALEQHPEAAELIGIEPRTSQLIVASIGALFAALGSTLSLSLFVLTPLAWLDALLLAFVAVVVGGLGSTWGAFAGVFIIAYAETVVGFFVPKGGFLRVAIYLGIMVIVLLARPWGFFGQKE